MRRYSALAPATCPGASCRPLAYVSPATPVECAAISSFQAHVTASIKSRLNLASRRWRREMAMAACRHTWMLTSVSRPCRNAWCRPADSRDDGRGWFSSTARAASVLLAPLALLALWPPLDELPLWLSSPSASPIPPYRYGTRPTCSMPLPWRRVSFASCWRNGSTSYIK